MVLIPAGDFVMGDTFGEGDSDELPLHNVTVRAFYMGETEVTKTQWDAVHGWAVTNGYAFENAGLGKAGNHPVHTVNWNDCVKWANARSEMEGLTACYTFGGEVYRTNAVASTVDRYASGYRLPTEAEWEYVCRAGTQTAFTFGDELSVRQANINCLPAGEIVPLGRTPRVGSYAPNAVGLYDVHGNVWEWCADGKRAYNTRKQKDPQGQPSLYCMLRGGGWDYPADFCRSDHRRETLAGYGYFGFRVLCEASK